MKIIKKHIYGKEAREKMMEGINEAADVVGSTMSAKGRNVILDREYGSPLIVNDGITILNELFFEDPVKNMGVQLLKDAAVRTNALGGDGTTATTVLARSIVRHGWELLGKGTNPVLLRKELEKARDKIELNLIKGADIITKKEQAIQIANVSVQDNELGEKIGSLMYDVGANGAVTIKNSLQRGVFIEKDGGMRIQGALTGGVVENGDKFETKFENPHVLILKDSPEDHEFETKWLPLMKQFAEGAQDEKGNMRITKVNVPVLLVIAEKLSRRFIMAMNQNKEIVKWVWFRPTTADKNMKEVYIDLQSMVGGDVVDEENGVFLSRYTLDKLSRAESVTVTRHELILTVTEEQVQDIRYLDRINVVKEQIENAEDEVEQNQTKERYANLTGGVAAIKVMAATEQDTIELKLRVEDAINATRAAMEEGYVAGGGIALFNASNIDMDTNGDKVLATACESALRQILYNAGYDKPDDILKKLKEGEGVNVLTDKVVNMKEEGIVDPLKVIKLALINAVSVAGLLLTSEYVVTNEDQDDVTTLREIFTRKE